jgi:TetR/AcrR family transcriptional regulator, mexJK operon transcriptional repressor
MTSSSVTSSKASAKAAASLVSDRDDIKRRAATHRRGNGKREKIVRSAARLFLEKGYDNVSINDIIDVVGGSKGTIYSNFGSKEKLFEAVVEQMCSDVTIQIDTRIVGTLDEQLTRIARSFVSNVLSPDILYFHRLMASIGRTFPKAGRLFYQTGPQTVYQIIGDWVAYQQGKGNIRDDISPRRLAVLFHDMLIGDQQVSWLTSASSEKQRASRIEETVRMAVSVFLQGCANTGPRRSARRATAKPAVTAKGGRA